MRCEDIQEKLSAYAAGELPPEGRDVVGAHLRECHQCRREADAVERAEAALAMLGAAEAAPDLSADLRRRLEARLRRRPRWALPAIAAAGALLAVVAGMWATFPREAAVPEPEQTAVAAAPPVRVRPDSRVIAERPEIPEVSPKAGSAVATVEPMSKCRRPVVVVVRPFPPKSVYQNRLRSAIRIAHVPPEAGAGRSDGGKAAAEAATPRLAAPQPALAATDPSEPISTERDQALVPSRETRRELPGDAGVVLLLRRPQPVQPDSSCYLEVSLPNGARSIFEEVANRDVAGTPRGTHISYEYIAPQPKAQNRGG